MSNWSYWDWIGNSVYLLLAIDAIWGAYCAVVVWMRLMQLRFKKEADQDQFLDGLEQPLRAGDFTSAEAICEGDRRVLPQLALLAIHNRKLHIDKLQELLPDRYSRDVLADLEGRVGWINNVIKTAPMLGLLGTVLGMMAAFGKLYTSSKVEPSALAGDISFALITTAIGLAIAIPATVFIASVNIRIRKMDELLGSGLSRLFDILAAVPAAGRR